ncbi:hypothetical protein GCM10009122_45010 [Fulvivirga kasyanovii]|uniref:Uncharacterized protein n=1 Tax=Fulvivirga kasyanovii TaxID=396812 RepID=A0ABW9RQL5_9BACT|nr:hypothetical protein [Fulvivirga kasyanovii]MTI25991.1 hypothetical protein [Fulvivirga kasyanovii]
MKKITDILLALTLATLALTAISCEENEPEITGIEPFFRIKFINQDSISTLNDSIAIINAELEAIADSLVVIDTLENRDEDADFSENKEALNAYKKLLNEDKTELNAIITLINSGKVQVTSVRAQNGIATLVYEDSLSLYRLPLNTNADFSRFIVTIDDQEYSLDAYYTREIREEERYVVIKAYDFNIPDYTQFDSLKISQRDSTNFSSNEATATAYF